MAQTWSKPGVIHYEKKRVYMGREKTPQIPDCGILLSINASFMGVAKKQKTNALFTFKMVALNL